MKPKKKRRVLVKKKITGDVRQKTSTDFWRLLAWELGPKRVTRNSRYTVLGRRLVSALPMYEKLPVTKVYR